jgi:4-carboxymuconolactone decarboxylase
MRWKSATDRQRNNEELLAVFPLAALFAAPQLSRAEDVIRFAPLKAEELSPPQKA